MFPNACWKQPCVRALAELRVVRAEIVGHRVERQCCARRGAAVRLHDRKREGRIREREDDENADEHAPAREPLSPEHPLIIRPSARPLESRSGAVPTNWGVC